MATATTGGGKKTTVSQATIDKIKQMGMTKALGGVKSTSGAEYKEALRRMYGQKRLDAALSKSTPVKYKTADSARAGAAASTAKMTDKTLPKNKSIATKTKTTKSSAYPKTTDKVFGVSVADWRKSYGAPANGAKPKPAKTAAQKAAEAKLTAARRKAAAAAVKAANGRTH